MSTITRYVARHAPKQTEIADGLLARIRSGEFAPGARIPSVLDLSKAYNSSPKTVQRVIESLRESGYLETTISGSTVSANPPHLSHFGLVFAWYPHTSQFLFALEKEAERLSNKASADGIKRRFPIFYEVNYPEKKLRQHSRLMAAVESNSVGGLIFAGGSYAFEEILHNHPELPCISFFGGTVKNGTIIRPTGFLERALQIVKEEGRERVALLTGAHERLDVTDRFVKSAERLGMKSFPHWVQGIHTGHVHWAETCAQLLMNGRETPDAIIISDDNFVPHATAGIAASGAKVPQDLMIVAHANFPYPTRSEVPAIRIGTDVRRLMRTAVETIEAKRRGENVPDEIVLQACFESEADS